jgi:hypothetical protein
MTALHWAIYRGRKDTATRLLNRGADPLLQNSEGLNALHQAARFSPWLMSHILAKINEARFGKPDGMHPKDIVSIATDEGQTAFSIAVIEGSTQHLEAAERLRTEYELDHDTLSIETLAGSAKMTLMAYLVQGAATSNLFTLDQVEYVLNIEPRPKLVADTINTTLLHYAVSAWHHGNLPASFSVVSY